MSGFVACALLLFMLTGCASKDTDTYDDPSVQMQPGFVAFDDYIYFPRVQIYYGIHSHKYFYQEGDLWVSRQAPRSRSVSSVLNTPSVKMSFHDQPAAHHAEVSAFYPKNWMPPVDEPGSK